MPDLMELVCGKCSYRHVCSGATMIEWLRQAKMVRRDTQPEPELVPELFRSSGAKFVCPKCGVTGLAVEEVADEDDEVWGMARACQDCGRPIDRERLEVFPNVKVCAVCQGKADRGELTGEPEYCPRCGNLMSVRPTRSAGITRHALTCSKCRG